MPNVPDVFSDPPSEPADTTSDPHPIPEPEPDPVPASGWAAPMGQFLQLCSSTLHCESWVSFWRLVGILFAVSVPITAVVGAILLVRAFLMR